MAEQARALHGEWSADRAGDEQRFVEALKADLILPIDF